MQVSAHYFNAHANMNRVDHEKRCGNCPAPAITRKDEAAYALSKEKAANAKRKVKISLPSLPF